MEIYNFLMRKMRGNEEEVERLAKTLKPFGVDVRFEPSSFMDDDDYYKLILVVDEEALEQKRTRNAGVKVKYNDAAYNETIGSIKERVKKESQEAVARSLGMSRMTLYRKLKKAEELGVDSDYPIYML